jgi:hypothetical protein
MTHDGESRARGPGSQCFGSPTGSAIDNAGPGERPGVDCMVTDGAVIHPLTQRFGQPSNYSLDPVTLATHVRGLRRDGWQSWEIRARFDFGAAA